MQSATESFGPVMGNKQTEFKVTSVFSSVSGMVPAIAVCDGIALVQEVPGNANLVNIIFKPKVQKSLAYTTIRFYIYKGIKKSSLIASGNIGPRTLNDLTKSIWESQDKINNVLNTSDAPSEKILGVHLSALAAPPFNFSDNTPIETFFFGVFEGMQLPNVSGGWRIGEFDPGHIGFEIVVGDGPFPVGLFRTLETKVSVPNFPSQASQGEQLMNMAQREKVLNYLDPCAFWATYYTDGLYVYNGSAFNFVQGIQLYSQVLDRFYTKNILYLDVRNIYNESYNFYCDNNRYFKYQLQGGSLQNVNYHDGNYWPFIALDIASLPLGGNKFDITITLPCSGSGDIKFFLGHGFYSDQFPKIHQRLRTVKPANQEVQITISWFSNATVGCPGYINLRYLEVDPVRMSNSMFVVPAAYINSLFDLNKIVANSGSLDFPFQTNKPTKWVVLNDEKFINSGEASRSGYLGKVGYAEDASSVYFFSFSNGEELGLGSAEAALLSGTSPSPSFLDDVLRHVFMQLAVEKEEIPVSASFNAASISEASEYVSVSTGRLRPSEQDLVVIAIDRISDFASIATALNQFVRDLPARLVLTNINELQDINGRPYTSAGFGIQGFILNAAGVQSALFDLQYKTYKV